MTTPGGRLGTYSSKVSWPKMRSHLTNHEKSFWRACRNRIPLPTRGNVLGGFLRLGLSARTIHYTERNGKEGGRGGWNQPVLLQWSSTSRDATLAEDGAQDQSDHSKSDGPSEERHCHDAILGGIEPIPGYSWVSAVQMQSAVWCRSAHGEARRHDVSVTQHFGYDAGGLMSAGCN